MVYLKYISMMDVQMEPSWKMALKQEFEELYFKNLVMHLKTERSSGQTIYPIGKHIFNAFNFTPIDRVKVVILGQDPYHNPNQAMGLSFSVPKGVKIPPSLSNIYKEIHADLGLNIPNHGDLTAWAEAGVLLLNATLTVRANEPNSHAQIGWQNFTDAVINCISTNCNHVVFLLWGKFAQQKRALINQNKHLVLQAAHPSPFSAHQGFMGCQHFSRANSYLVEHGKLPVDWFLA